MAGSARPATFDPDAQRAYFAAIVDDSDDAILAKDLSGIIRSWNRGATTLYGYTPEEIIGRSVNVLIPKERHGELERILEQVARGGKIAHHETVRRTKSGRLLDISVTISPVRNHQGRVVGASAIARDITQQKALQHALVTSEERLRLAKEAANLGTFDYHIPAAELHCDQRALDLWDVSAEPPLRLEQVLDRIHPDDRGPLVAAFEAALEPNGTRRLVHEYRVVSDDGDFRWVAVRGSTIMGDGGAERMVGTLIDITEQKRVLQELRRADAQKDEFIAMLGHELRNPLAAIRTAAEVLLVVESDDPLLAKVQQVLERQSSHMGRLLDGLLDVSRIVRGRIVLERKPVDLVAVATEVTSECRRRMESHGLEMSLSVPDHPVIVEGDPIRLAQVLDNLLTNAMRFTPLHGTITVTLTTHDHQAVVSVADTGVGIEPELLGLIFEPFRQATQPLDRAVGGLGLGLALVKRLVELHGGDVRATSPGPSQGATFTVRLPLAKHQTVDALTGSKRGHEGRPEGVRREAGPRDDQPSGAG